MKAGIYTFINSKTFIRICLGIVCLLLFIQSDRRFGYTSKAPKNNYAVVSDGTGYFAYLPQYIVYPDSKNFSFQKNITAKYPEADFFSMLYLDTTSNTFYNKFYVGTALLQSPFYAIAHAYHVVSDGEADGYSLGYRFSIQLAALFYWLVGVLALFSLFTRLNYSRFTILIGVICITLGTNLSYYLVYNPSYSHIYSFCFIALFLNYVHLWSQTRSLKHLIYLSICISIIAIVRPVNVLIILIVPFFFSNWNSFLEEVKHMLQHRLKWILACLIIGIGFIFIQLLSQYHQSGEWNLYSYKSEGFSNILHPQFWNVFFSYQKGYFIYSPFMFLLIPACYFLWKQSSRYFYWGWIIVNFIILYIIVSWWDWTYGGGLGNRPFIDFLPLYLFAILALFKMSKPYVKIVLAFFIIGSIAIYQLFQIQFNQNIILYSGMDQAKFWKVFMKTDARYSWMLQYHYERLPKTKLVNIQTIEYNQGSWQMKETNDSCLTFVPSGDDFLLLPNKKKLSQFAQLEGNVKIYDQANNPTLEAIYYSNGNVVHKSEQPLGNKIDRVNSFEPVDLEFNPKIDCAFDSIRFKLLHYGKQNDYSNFIISILEKPSE